MPGDQDLFQRRNNDERNNPTTYPGSVYISIGERSNGSTINSIGYQQVTRTNPHHS